MDRPLLTNQEFATGLAELQLRGLVEYRSEDEIRLTTPGIDSALNTWFSMSPADRIIMRLFMEDVDIAISEEDPFPQFRQAIMEAEENRRDKEVRHGS